MFYCFSRDGKAWTGREGTRDLARWTAISQLRLPDGNSFYTAAIFPVPLKDVVKSGFSLNGVMSSIGDYARKLFGESSRDWPFVAPSRHEMATVDKRFEEQLVDLITKFLQDNAPPEFWDVRDVQQHTA